MTEMSTPKPASKLARTGVVSIEGYIEADLCDELRENILAAIESGMEVTNRARRDYSYQELAQRDVAIVDKRQGRDEGMWDAFNIDQEIPEVRFIKMDSMIDDIINEAAGEEFMTEAARSIRPGEGLEPKHLEDILGSRATCDLERGTPMTRAHLGEQG